MTTRYDKDQATTKTLDPLVPLEEAATLLDIHPYSMRRYLLAGHVKGVRIGRMWKLKTSEIERYQREGIPSLPRKQEAARA
jgi:hypothetical protein